MRRTLFQKPWFAGNVFRGINAALRDDAVEGIRAEGGFLARFFADLLDSHRAGDFEHAELHDFFKFALARVDASHAQIFQDLWVLHTLREKRGGYFVEFGACDGVALSNTKLLEQDYGWSGVLAEPNPVWHAALAANRSAAICHQCVYARSGEHLQLRCTLETPELSRIESIVPNDVHEGNGNRETMELIDVETISLNDLLDAYDAPEEIDYVSIDTEGSELEILEAFDFSKRRVRLWTVEHGGDLPRRKQIEALMSAHGYRRWWTEISRWDDWYVAP